MTPPTLRLMAFFLLLTLVIVGCGDGPAVDPRTAYQFPQPADMSQQGRTEAFKAMHTKFSAEYALGEWKGVDWHAIYTKILPRVERAAAANDPEAYYTALHEYVFSISDGHILIPSSAITQSLKKKQSGGGFGLALAELDDGRVIAVVVYPGGPAEAAGIRAGAEVITWGGVPVASAMERVPLESLAALTHPMATAAHLRLEQARFLTRAPVGTTLQLSWRNPGTATVGKVLLTAVDDGFLSLQWTGFTSSPTSGEQTQVVLSKALPSGYGYIRITAEGDPLDPDHYPERIRQKFQDSLAPFVAAGSSGMIIDLRGNAGGSDQLAADICGFFRADRTFYEFQEYYDPATGGFIRYTADERNPGTFMDALLITPQPLYYGGPVVALINPATISSGEGIALCINDLPQGAAVGFHGTWGSFGMMGGSITMPDGISLLYPNGRSVDSRGVVQLDSRNGIGGVQPKVRIPKSYATVMSLAQGTDVELDYAIRYLSGDL